jgi:hypothetical protein
MPSATSILETVPPVPDSCKQEVQDAQSTLKTIAEGLESLEIQNQWLSEQATAGCMSLEPALAESLNQQGPMVDFT